MMRSLLQLRLISFGVVAALVFAIVRPAYAQDDEGGADYKDPSIVTDYSTSVPDGVKDIVKKNEAKPIDNPIYQKWWFWATAIGVAGAWITFAMWPLRKQAPGCGSVINLGCFGDGRQQ